MIHVESGGNARAIGDLHLAQKAYGPLQIRQPVCDDVNRHYGTSFRPEQMLGNFELSIAVMHLYWNIYATRKQLGFEPTDETRARIWNGGPTGWRRETTEGYWRKVKRAMNSP